MPLPWGAIISGIGGLFGGWANARAQNRENQAAAEQANLERRMGIEGATRRAAKLEDLAGVFRQFGERQNPYAGQQQAIAQQLMGPNGQGLLQAEAARQLERNSGMLDSALAARGMYSSGYGVNQQRMLSSEMMGSLAQAIAQNRAQGLSAASNIYSGLSADDMQRQQTMLGGLQGVYGDASWAMAGVDPNAYDWNPPQASGWDTFLSALGGAFGGAGTAFAADPDMFNAIGGNKTSNVLGTKAAPMVANPLAGGPVASPWGIAGSDMKFAMPQRGGGFISPSVFNRMYPSNMPYFTAWDR